MSSIKYSTFPRTKRPPDFAEKVAAVFKEHEKEISTLETNGPESEELLELLRPGFEELGFLVETGKKKSQRIERPVFFGENGKPGLEYQIDAWHPEWCAGLETEAGRAIQGNALYRDLIQSLVMVDMKHLIVAMPFLYRYGKDNSIRKGYEAAVNVGNALYGHSRVDMPFSLCVIGY